MKTSVYRGAGVACVVLLLALEATVAADSLCPTNFIRVPANPAMGTYQDFCVAKYEMKIQGHDNGDVPYNPAYVAESRASGTPWKNLTMQQARDECQALGDGYDLIANEEWMTIARNIESVASNWSDHQAHAYEDTSAVLCIGHSCRKGLLGIDCRQDQTPYSGEGLPASTNDAEGCYGYVKGDYEPAAPTLNSNGWHLYRRTFFLDNGECIWDFAGNVWEWTTLYVPLAADRPRRDGIIDDNYLEINEPNSNMHVMPPAAFKSSRRSLVPATINGNRFGRFHPCSNDYTQGVAMRGGNYMHGAYNNGIYAIGMGYAPTSSHIICEVGFRAVYHPFPSEHDEDGDGVADAQEVIAGTCPTNHADYPQTQIAREDESTVVEVPRRVPGGAGAQEYARYYQLQTITNLNYMPWGVAPGCEKIPAAAVPFYFTNHVESGHAFFRHQIWIETE